MVKVRKSLIGETFGRWVVLRQAEDYVSSNGTHYARWLCECSCEEHNRAVILGSELERGRSQSCGCLQKEKTSQAKKKYNKYDLTGDYGIGWTSNTNKEFYFDLDDYNLIKNYCWMEHIGVDGYHALEARNPEDKKIIRMHYLFGCKGWDHIDRNPLNNRRNNLRFATTYENAQNISIRSSNISGAIGVTWHKRDQIWMSRITVNDKKIYIGSFVNKEDAIKARLQAEKKYCGDFAPQKHLFEQYGITEQND